MGTRAHTVPNFYLRHFETPGGDSEREPFLWVGLIRTGEVKRRSPKNLSIARGFYDGPGGFSEPDASIEKHLAVIESEAAPTFRYLASNPESGIGPEIWRFLAWQAARTPGWMELEQKWINEQWDGDPVEAPPAFVAGMKDRVRPLLFENPSTGEQRYTDSREEQDQLQQNGWTRKLDRADRLELLHMQAKYFEDRHFSTLQWVQLTAPDNEFFVTSDRVVTWLVDGYVDTPPAALRHPSVQVVAPLTKKLVLVGRHGTSPINERSRSLNRFIACCAADWIAGPTREIVEQALQDRCAPMPLAN